MLKVKEYSSFEAFEQDEHRQDVDLGCHREQAERHGLRRPHHRLQDVADRGQPLLQGAGRG